MNGHQLHGVARRILFQRNGAAGLVEILEIFDELRQAARLALRFPGLDKFGEAFHVGAVLLGSASVDFQPLEKLSKDFPPQCADEWSCAARTRSPAARSTR